MLTFFSISITARCLITVAFQLVTDYDTNHMKLIEREIMSRVQKCNDESYHITVHDVMNAVTHLKDGKSNYMCCYPFYLLCF